MEGFLKKTEICTENNTFIYRIEALGFEAQLGFKQPDKTIVIGGEIIERNKKLAIAGNRIKIGNFIIDSSYQKDELFSII